MRIAPESVSSLSRTGNALRKPTEDHRTFAILRMAVGHPAKCLPAEFRLRIPLSIDLVNLPAEFDGYRLVAGQIFGGVAAVFVDQIEVLGAEPLHFGGGLFRFFFFRANGRIDPAIALAVKRLPADLPHIFGDFGHIVFRLGHAAEFRGRRRRSRATIARHSSSSDSTTATLSAAEAAAGDAVRRCCRGWLIGLLVKVLGNSLFDSFDAVRCAIERTQSHLGLIAI